MRLFFCAPMAVGGEKGAVQNPFVRYAQEAGWTYLSPEQALDLRRGITSPVLDSVLVRQLQRLNPGVVRGNAPTGLETGQPTGPRAGGVRHGRRLADSD